MTREEAIAILIREIDEDPFMRTEHRELIHGALNMAIKALEQEPCDDCVRRQDVLDILKDEWNTCLDADDAMQESINAIKALQPVTPQPKIGKWIAQDVYNCHTNFKCSECGYIHSFMHLYGEPTADYTYCPNCGTKMESEDKI